MTKNQQNVVLISDKLIPTNSLEPLCKFFHKFLLKIKVSKSFASQCPLIGMWTSEMYSLIFAPPYPIALITQVDLASSQFTGWGLEFWGWLYEYSWLLLSIITQLVTYSKQVTFKSVVSSNHRFQYTIFIGNFQTLRFSHTQISQTNVGGSYLLTRFCGGTGQNVQK